MRQSRNYLRIKNIGKCRYEGKVSISEQEHKALLEYFLVKDRMENEERLYHYLYGHIHCYEYMKKIGVIKHENQ